METLLSLFDSKFLRLSFFFEEIKSGSLNRSIYLDAADCRPVRTLGIVTVQPLSFLTSVVDEGEWLAFVTAALPSGK